MTSRDDEAAITRLLAEHRSMRLGKLVDPRQWECWCGQELGPLGIDDMRLEEDHRAHVAAVLAAHMADREAAAWREGCLAVCNGGIDECGMSEPHMHPELNPFRLTPDTEGETDE